MPKTIKVEKIRKTVNSMLAFSPDENRGDRRGMMTLLETILHDTGNYRGFGYLTKKQLDDSNGFAKTPGINDYQNPDGTSNFDGCDNTRVFYY